VVTEPVWRHVAAKRYLCATEPGYLTLLSPAPVYTLSGQGGPMTEAEARAFEAGGPAADAIAVRRWDDQRGGSGAGRFTGPGRGVARYCRPARLRYNRRSYRPETE
jgi:predicted HD phosphohydrolase